MKIKALFNSIKIVPTLSRTLDRIGENWKLKITLLAICFIVLSPQETSAALILQAPKYIGLNSGLVGYWSFNGPDMASDGNNITAYDRSGNANNGTLTNGPTRAIGKLGQALSFDGVDDLITGSGINLANSPLTISAWIKPRPWDSDRSYFGLGDVGGTDLSIHLRETSDTGLRFGMYLDDLDVTVSNMANVWSYIVVTLDPAKTQTLYFNGNSVNSRTAGGMFSGNTAWRIGKAFPTDGYFNGLIDDVRIYNRALNQDEIKRLYKIGATLKLGVANYSDTLQNGLVGYWSFNAPDIAGTTAYDRSGQGKNGSALGQDISSSGLVGWWRLDGASSGSIADGTTVGFEDFSGSGNNGTAKNTNGTGMAWTTGKIGLGATIFDGTDDHIQLGTPRIGNNTAFTISAWFKVDVGRTDTNVMYVETASGEPYLYLIVGNGGAGKVSFIETSDAVNFHNIRYTITDDGLWHHAVGVRRSLSSAELYVDGVSRGTDSTTIGSFGTPNFSFIGSWTNEATYFFHGSLDEIRIYNRAISAAEVAQLYSYGLPKFAPAVGKIGQGIDSTLSYVNPGNVSSSVNSFAFWLKTASSSPTINLLDLNASQYINIVAGTVKANGITSPSIFVDGVSGSTVNAGWHHITVTTGTAVNASAVNLGLNATTTAPLDGAIDDVRFYNRVINGDEIKRLYRIGATLKVNTSINNDSLTRGLVGYWSFDGKDMANITAFDRSGNANNGTLTNGPTRAIGRIGQALSFDGSNDSVNVGTPTILNNMSAFSISAWIYPKSRGANNSGDVVRKCCNGWSFQMADTAVNAIRLFVHHSTTNLLRPTAANTISLNTWQHVVMTWDGSVTATNVHIYRDGVEMSYDTPTNGDGARLDDSATSLTISGGNAFDGLIDDVRVYNRALTGDEIKRLYNLGR